MRVLRPSPTASFLDACSDDATLISDHGQQADLTRRPPGHKVNHYASIPVFLSSYSRKSQDLEFIPALVVRTSDPQLAPTFH